MAPCGLPLGSIWPPDPPWTPQGQPKCSPQTSQNGPPDPVSGASLYCHFCKKKVEKSHNTTHGLRRGSCMDKQECKRVFVMTGNVRTCIVQRYCQQPSEQSCDHNHNTTQHSTAQHNTTHTTQHNTTQHGHNTTQHEHNTTQHNTRFTTQLQLTCTTQHGHNINTGATQHNTTFGTTLNTTHGCSIIITIMELQRAHFWGS